VTFLHQPERVRGLSQVLVLCLISPAKVNVLIDFIH